MRRLLLFFLLASTASATTTVTGQIQNLGTGTVAGSFVRFWLRGCGANIPRVNGTAIIGPSINGTYYFDIFANASGVVSGTLYSTRDSTGLLGGDIECGGSKTSVWYGMQAFGGGRSSAEVPVHAKNASTLDITQVTPISTPPVITAPNGDSTYLRLDAGNSPLSGNLSVTGSIAPSGSGTNTANSVSASTVSSLPSASSNSGKVYVVTDAANMASCGVGSGSFIVLCRSNGTSWQFVGGATTGIAAELLGANPNPATTIPSTNLTAIQNAVNSASSAGVESTLLTPGIFYTSGTIVAPSNSRLRLGPNTMIRVCPNWNAGGFCNTGTQGVPAIENLAVSTWSSTTSVTIRWSIATTAASLTSNVATLTMASNPVTAGYAAGQTFNVSGFTGADTYFNGTFTISTVSSTQITYADTHANGTASTNGVVVMGNTGMTFSVGWTSHGFTCQALNTAPCSPDQPTYVYLSGANQRQFLGVFQVYQITDTNDFLVTAFQQPTGNPTGTTVGHVADTNIEISGGLWDWNSPTNVNTAVDQRGHTIIMAGAQAINIHDIRCLHGAFFCVLVQADRDVTVRNVSSGFTNSDIVHTYGPLWNFHFENISGRTNDDCVDISPTDWASVFSHMVGGGGGGDIINGTIVNVDCEQFSTGSEVAFYPHPTFITDQIHGKNISGRPGGGFVVKLDNDASSGFSTATIGTVSFEGITGTAGGNALVSVQANASGTLTVSSLKLSGLSCDQNSQASSPALVSSTFYQTTEQLEIDNSRCEPATWPVGGADSPFKLQGTYGTVKLDGFVFNPGVSNFADIMHFQTSSTNSPTVGNVTIQNSTFSNCNEVLGTGYPFTLNVTFINNTINCAFGIFVTSPIIATVFGGNVFNPPSASSPFFNVNANTTITYTWLGNTIQNSGVISGFNGFTVTDNHFAADNSIGGVQIKGIYGTIFPFGNVTGQGSQQIQSGSGGVVTSGTASQTVLRCLTAGAVLPAGALTTSAGTCGTSTNAGLTVN